MNLQNLITIVASRFVMKNRRTFTYVLVALTAVSAALTTALTVPVCDALSCVTLIEPGSALAKAAPLLATITTALAGMLSTADSR